MISLSTNWVKYEFDQVFKVLSSKKYQIKKSNYLEIGKIPVIDQGKKRIVGYTNELSKKYVNTKGVIVFGDHTLTFKYIDFDFVVGADGTKVLELIDSENFNLKFLFYQFLSRQYKILGYRRHFKIIKKDDFTIPTLEEQKGIVAKIDNLFSKIDKAISLTEDSLKKAKNLFTSSLSQIFDDLNQSYNSYPLTKYVDFVGGSQPPKSSFSYELKEGFIRLIQIRDYKTDNHIVYINKDSTKKFCEADDVMIGRYGPPVFQILRGIKGAYNVALMKAIPNESMVSKDFLFYFLQNSSIQNYIISISQRSAGHVV